jgi:hypothetical protein
MFCGILVFLICTAALIPLASAVTLSPGGSLGGSAATISNGDPVFIQGIATGQPRQGLQVWIMGPNFFRVSTVPVDADNTYNYELRAADTMQLSAGQYYVLVQHPMMNAQFDVFYDTATGRIINRQLGNSGSAIFQIAGGGSLQSSDAAFALARAISSQNIDDTFAPTGFTVSPPVVPIDPIPDHVVGDRFTISGSTNLAVGDELSISVISSSFAPTSKSQSGEFSGAAGVVRVVPGSGGLNHWSLEVDTASWKADEYIVTVESVTVDVRDSATFNVLAYRPTPSVNPTTVVTTQVPTTVVPTTVPTTVPPVTRSPLPGTMVIGALARAALLILRRKE